MESWNEEDLKNKIIVPFFESRDFNLTDMNFERPYKINVGTKRITIRSDILVRLKGQPVFVVEIKRPRHKINVDDINQAISYARLHETVVPYAIVTNLKETKVFDVFTKQEIKQLKSFKVVSQISEKSQLADELKYEALRRLFHLNYDFLLDFCHAQRKLQMSHLSDPRIGIGRFAKELFLPRQIVMQQFESFLKSEDPCFVLTGDQGTGKTFTSIALAEECGKSRPVLFYDGAIIPNGLRRAIEDDFGWKKSRKPWFGNIVANLEEILDKHSSKLIIFFDAINEPVPDYLRKKDIVNLIRRIDGTPIKLYLACRSKDWRFFFMDKGELGALSWWAHTPHRKHGISSLSIENVLGSGSCKVENFTDAELAKVFLKYKETYELSGNLSKEARILCKHPETLRIVSEIYQGMVLPQSLRRLEVFKRFWQKKTASLGKPEVAEHLLFSIGSIILKTKTIEVSVRKLIDLIGWNDVYQNVYDKALSENILQVRQAQDGITRVRILSNLLLEYILARLLFQKYPKELNQIASNATAITAELDGLPMMDGVMLLYSSLVGNPQELVSYLADKLDAKIVLQHMLEEAPRVVNQIATEQSIREKIVDDLSKEMDSSKLISMVSELLVISDEYIERIIVELILSKEFQVGRIRLVKLLSFIIKRVRSGNAYSKILNLLLDELEDKGQRTYADFLYRVNSISPSIAKKLLIKFKVGRLRRLITSNLSERIEAGRTLYILSKIHPGISSRLDPEHRILKPYLEALKSGKAPRPVPMKYYPVSKKKIFLTEQIFQTLNEESKGLSWKALCENIKTDRFKILAVLERLLIEEVIVRETEKGEVIIYEVLKGQDIKSQSLKEKLGFASTYAVDKRTRYPPIRKFTDSLAESDFSLTREEIDKNVEFLMLGRGLENWKTAFDFVFSVFSCSIDISVEQDINNLTIPGKTFRYMVEWLLGEKGFRKSLAFAVVNQLSRTAPSMFKNMIFGVRKRQLFRTKQTIKIESNDQLRERLREFAEFFGEIGVRVPTEDIIFEKCMDDLKGPIGEALKLETLIPRLKTIFKERTNEILSEERRIMELHTA